MRNAPSTNGGNGNDRNAKGQFVKGHPGGPGNPHVSRVASWRAAMVDTVTDDDMRAVVRVLIENAKAGEPWAIRELLDRTLGKPTPPPADAEVVEPRVLVVEVPGEEEFKLRGV